MSRHRIVRSMNYEDEYYDEEEEYSRSVEDSYCISPGTAAQFTWNRDRDRNLDFTTYMGGAPVIDEEGEEEEESSTQGSLGDSASGTRLALSETDQALLNSCLEEIRNIIGDTVSEAVMSDVIIQNKFNIEASLNQLLSQQDQPKPQREPRQRRNRPQDDLEEQGKGFEENEVTLQSTGLRTVFGKEVSEETDFVVKDVTRTLDSKTLLVAAKQCDDRAIPNCSEVDSTLSKLSSAKDSKMIQSTGLSLSDLIAKENSLTTEKSELQTIGKKATSSLADLSKQHDKGDGSKVSQSKSVQDGMVKLSSLVAQHSLKKVAAPGNVTLPKHPILVHARAVGKSLSLTASKTQDVQQETSGSPSKEREISSGGLSLSDMARKHKEQGNGSMDDSKSIERQKCSSILSSSPQGIQKGFANMSLSDLARKHKDMSPHSFHQEGQASSPDHSLSFLNMHHRQDMSELCKDHTSAEASSSPMPSGLSLAVLSKQHKDHSPSETSGASKHTLGAKSPSTALSSGSLSALIKQQKNETKENHGVESDKSKSDFWHSFGKITISKEDHSRDSKHVSTRFTLTSCLKTTASSSKSRSFSQTVTSPSENHFEDDDLFTSGMVLMESSSSTSAEVQRLQQTDSSLLSEASGIGLTLCCFKRKRKITPTVQRDPKYGTFFCKTQLKERKLYREQTLHKLTAFDFSTPSPDDVIKRKQNQAFTRSDKEYSVN